MQINIETRPPASAAYDIQNKRRVETIDFAEKNAQTLGGGGLANECGIFGCIEIGRSWRR